MTTTSYKMNRHSIACFLLTTIIVVLLLSSCSKHDPPHGNHASSYPSDVLDKWMTMQIRLMRNATGIPNQAFSRHYAYAGIAALESIAPGIPSHFRFTKKWNGLTGLPHADHRVRYYWPANVNAALAAFNRAMFVNAGTADKEAIDSLETALNQ